MATQYEAANGKALLCPLTIDNYTLQSLGIPVDKLPKGLVGFDVDSGLAIVKTSPDTKSVKMRIGKLLKRLGKPEAEVTVVGNNANKLKQMAKLPLKFTTTPEEVLKVYQYGPQSCMRKCDAVQVYATNDVAVAYLELDGIVLARSVVCKNEDIGLQYVCAYGLADVLEAILEKAGYCKGSLKGCELLKIQEDDGYLMPYLDGCVNEIDVNHNSMTVTDCGELVCDTTNGVVGLVECHECEDLIAPDEVMLSGSTGEKICRSCHDQAHVEIDYTYYYKESNDVQLLEDGSYVLAEDATYVEERDEYHLTSECVYNSYTNNYHLREDLELD